MVNNPRYPCASLASALVTLLAACSTSPRAVHTSPEPQKIQYPAATRGTVVDDYHGTRVPDPYRWFEDASAQNTRDWVAAQNSVSQPFLERLPQRLHRRRVLVLAKFPDGRQTYVDVRFA